MSSSCRSALLMSETVRLKARLKRMARADDHRVLPGGPAGHFRYRDKDPAALPPNPYPVTALYAQMITEFYMVGLLTAAATLVGGCLVLPTMARNALRSTVSQILTVRMRALCGAGG